MVYSCRRGATGKAMAELAVSVGQQLMHGGVDYDNNKHQPPTATAADSVPDSRRIHVLEPAPGLGGGGGGGDPSCLLDLHPASDFQLPANDCAAPPTLATPPGDDPTSLLSDDPTQSCDAATSNTSCAHCGLIHLRHHHHHHHPRRHYLTHHHQQQQQQQQPPPLVYGQLCVDGSLSDAIDRYGPPYPVGLRTPQQ